MTGPGDPDPGRHPHARAPRRPRFEDRWGNVDGLLHTFIDENRHLQLIVARLRGSAKSTGGSRVLFPRRSADVDTETVISAS